MKKLFLGVFFWGCLVSSVAQNKPILYNFDKIPQTLLLNPGAETTYKYHIGIPFLSGNSVGFGVTTITVADLFKDDGVGIFAGTNFNTKLRNAVNKLNEDDYAYANAQVEILSGGYKLNNSDYVSGGFYTELDAFASMPKDLLTLAIEGNAAYLNKPFSISQVNIKSEVIGVLHAGISRRFNNRFMAGARFKIYSGSVSAVSTDNKGTFTTSLGNEGIYKHRLTGLNVEANSSGVYNENDELDITVGNAFGGTFFGGNFGAGIDLGFTSYWDEQLQFSASILDIGFINYSKDNRNAKANGSYVFEGINFLYDSQNNSTYWTDLDNDFKQKVPRENNRESYVTMRPIKLNGSVRYSFGQSRNRTNCHDISFKDFYDNAVGGQLYSVFRPTGPKFAVTAFYERKFTKFLNTKVTYTIDDFSATNFGLGVSSNFWKLNVYVAADNVVGLFDVADTHTASLQFGVNFIIN